MTLTPTADQSKPTLPGVSLSVVLVSYNTRDMTLKCIECLLTDLQFAGAEEVEIFLVDNASTDGSVDAVREKYNRVKLIENSENVGFGRANNQAMRQARGKFILLLNTDAFVKPGAIVKLLHFIQTPILFGSVGMLGVVGPRLLNADGSLQQSCYRFPSPSRAVYENFWLSAMLPNHPVIGDYRFWPHDSVRSVDWVIGACMLIRREVFDATGGFDERFFMYAEEADWQKRIRSLGWDIGFTPDALVTHLGGASGAKEKARINRHFFESLDYYERKHHGVFGLTILRLAMIIGCSLRAILWSMVWLIPAKRALARDKIKLHCWLVSRQATHWSVNI